MASAQQVYAQQLQEEIKQIPQEYMPALIDIVHAFRTGVTTKSATSQQKAKMKQDTEEALDDVKANRIIDGNEVLDWLDTWGSSEEIAPKQ